MNATKLRADLYAVLDSVLETGKPVIIERRGRRLVLSVDKAPKRSSKKRWPDARPDWVNGNVEELVHIDWSKEWRP